MNGEAASSSQSNNQGKSSQVQFSATISSNIAHNVAMRFRTDKFTVDIGESWNEYVAEYQQVHMDHNLGNQQKLQYLHNIIEGDAKRFYLNNVQPHVNTYAIAVELINQEYNYPVRQNTVKNILSQLRLCNKLGENQDEDEALAKVYRVYIKDLTRFISYLR